MAKMKDSGIEWIGEIPEEWTTVFCKYNFNIVSGSTPESSKREYWDGDIFWITPADYKTDDKYVYQGKRNITLSGFRSCSTNLIPSGSIIFSKRAPIGTVAINKNDLCTNQGCLACIPLGSNYNCDYYYYLFSIGTEHYNLLGSGTTFKEISATSFENSKLPLPPPETQKRIADFLDAKCAKIDGLKNDIQKQIEILEQYKKSVITEAVTKGINPNAKMKDSGVEWIGNIPENWEVSNPKWHFTQRKDRAKLGLKQYTASQKYGVISQEEYMERTGAKIVTVAKDFDILKLVCPGDFVIHMRSFQGGLEYSEAYGSISSAYVMLIPQKTIANPRYYRWFFKSPVYIDALSSTSNLIRDGQAMRYANFVQIPILIPTADEQTDIADYLDKKCSSIDSIISTKKQQLEKLEEYKKSLIFEYVTGKKKC